MSALKQKGLNHKQTIQLQGVCCAACKMISSFHSYICTCVLMLSSSPSTVVNFPHSPPDSASNSISGRITIAFSDCGKLEALLNVRAQYKTLILKPSFGDQLNQKV